MKMYRACWHKSVARCISWGSASELSALFPGALLCFWDCCASILHKASCELQFEAHLFCALCKVHTDLCCTRVCRMQKRLRQLPFYSHLFLKCRNKITLPRAWEWILLSRKHAELCEEAVSPTHRTAGFGQQASCVNELSGNTCLESL